MFGYKWLFALPLLFGGCGYRFDGEATEEGRITLSIPYVNGDPDGLLTDELIRQCSASGVFEYMRDGGEYSLQVNVVKDENHRIGFRYDRNDTTGAVKSNLIPIEFRRVVAAEVMFVHCPTGEIAFGPEVVTGSGEYDTVNPSAVTDLTFINPLGVREKVIQFSLGQLDTPEGGQDNVRVPLYRDLAQIIVDGIVNTL